MNEDRFGTPLSLFHRIQKAFGRVDCDCAAEPWSALCARYITAQQDFFKVRPRGQHGFGNWPYSRGSLIRFMPEARQLVLDGHFAEFTNLVPHYTDTEWWKRSTKPEGKVLRAEWRYGWLPEPLQAWTRYISAKLIIDVIEIDGRLEHRFPPRYTGAREIARFPSAIVRFVRPNV